MGESMDNAGFAIGSSSPQATEDAKTVASASVLAEIKQQRALSG
jgi:hypothetical protein